MQLRKLTYTFLAVAFVCLFAVSVSHAGFLYLLNDENTGSRIYGFEVNETTGALTALTGFPVTAGAGGLNSIVSERMTVDPLNRRLYVVNDGADSVSAYSIDPATGALTPMPFSPVAIGTGTWNSIAVHPSGSPLVIGNGASGGGAVSLVITSSSATPAAGSPFLLGAATTFSSRFSHDGAYYYTGGNTGMNIAGFSVDSSTGVLTALAGSPFTTGANNPVAHAVDAAGRYFVVDTLDEIRVFTTSAGIPTAVSGNPFPSGLTQRRFGLVHPNGLFYIVAGNTGNNVGVFQISGSGAATTVAAVTGSPFPTGGTTANAIALNQAGTFLYVANRISRNVTSFAFNTSTGELSGQTVQPSNTLGTSGAINGIAYLPDAIASSGIIAGQVLTAKGTAVGNVTVTLTVNGTVVGKALTSPFGYYNFPAVATGATYVATPEAKGYTFTPPSVVINHTGDITNVNFTAQP